MKINAQSNQLIKVGIAETRICILEHHYHYNHIISHPVPSHKSLSSSSPLSIMLADELATAAPAGLNIFCPLVLHFNTANNTVVEILIIRILEYSVSHTENLKAD